MAVKLRLKRIGSTKKPFYRIVVADSRNSRDGKFIELIGTYDVFNNEEQIKLDEEKVMSWLEKGAQPTDTVRNILSKKGIMKKFKANKKEGK